MSNDKDKSCVNTMPDQATCTDDDECNDDECEDKELFRLYSNKRQRDWAERNRRRSREIKKASYQRIKQYKWREVGLQEKKRLARGQCTVEFSVDCEGECDIYSCDKCRKFYDTPLFDEASNVLTVEKHPWHEKMGLEQPGLWPRVGEQWIPLIWQEYNVWFKWRQEYSVTEWGLHGSRNWVGNENRKHPVMMLLMEAYEFVNLPEPVSAVSGPLGKVQLPMLQDVWALQAKSSCRAQPVCNGRRWKGTCKCWRMAGQPIVFTSLGGECERCAVVGPRSEAREQVQAAAERALRTEALAQAERWVESWRFWDFTKKKTAEEKAEGIVWRRQWKAGLLERVAKRAAATAIALRVARRHAQAWYAQVWYARCVAVGIV